MPIWFWFIAPAAVLLAALSLFRLRFRVDWSPDAWSAFVAYGIPGLMRSRRFPARPASPPAPLGGTGGGQGGFLRLPHFRRLRNRLRRALFHLATDASILKALLGFAWGRVLAAVGLLNVRARLSLGHPDPALLGRVAGYRAAAAALPGSSRLRLTLRFQDRKPSAALQVLGGFSAFGLLGFLCASAWRFPWATALRAAWRGWRNADLSGWRALVYRRVAGARA